MKHQTAGLVVYVNKQELVGELEVDRNAQMVWSDSAQADPKWSFIDQAGHFHAYDQDEKLPTLRNEPEHIDCDGGCGGLCEGYETPRYLCRICGEEVTPGPVPGPHQFAVNGPAEWTVHARGEGGLRPQPGEQVSVRIVDREGILFGVARVCGGTIWSMDEQAMEFEVELAGEGPLSRTDATHNGPA